jgi:hypothetical protein
VCVCVCVPVCLVSPVKNESLLDLIGVKVLGCY